MQGFFQLSTFSKLLCLLVICLAYIVNAEEIPSPKSPESRDMRFVPPYSNFCRSLISEKSYLLKYQSWKVAQIPVICLPYLLEIKKTGLQIRGNCGIVSAQFEDKDFTPLYGSTTEPFLYKGALKTGTANVCQSRPMNGRCTCSLKELAEDPTSTTMPVIGLVPDGCSCKSHCFSTNPKSSDLDDKCFVDIALKDFETPDYTTVPPRTKLMVEMVKCECKEQVPGGKDKVEYTCQCEKNN